MLGQKLLTDIDAADLSRYQQHRLKQGAAAKTINLRGEPVAIAVAW